MDHPAFNFADRKARIRRRAKNKAALLVLDVMLDNCDHDGEVALDPDLARLRELTELKSKKIEKAIASLESDEVIVARHRPGDPPAWTIGEIAWMGSYQTRRKIGGLSREIRLLTSRLDALENTGPRPETVRIQA